MSFKKETISTCVGCPDKHYDCGKCKGTSVTFYCDDCGEEIPPNKVVYSDRLRDFHCEKCMNNKFEFLWSELSNKVQKLLMEASEDFENEYTPEEANEVWRNLDPEDKMHVLGFEDDYTINYVFEIAETGGDDYDDREDLYDDFLPF